MAKYKVTPKDRSFIPMLPTGDPGSPTRAWSASSPNFPASAELFRLEQNGSIRLDLVEEDAEPPVVEKQKRPKATAKSTTKVEVPPDQKDGGDDETGGSEDGQKSED